MPKNEIPKKPYPLWVIPLGLSTVIVPIVRMIVVVEFLPIVNDEDSQSNL